MNESERWRERENSSGFKVRKRRDIERMGMRKKKKIGKLVQLLLCLACSFCSSVLKFSSSSSLSTIHLRGRDGRI